MNNEILEFCMNNPKIIEVVKLYEKNFKKAYKKIKGKDKNILLNLKDTIFKKWYYSSLLEEDVISPANYINEYVRRNFSDEYVIVPHVKANLKGKELGDFEYNIKFFSLSDHPVIKDLQTLINEAVPVLELENKEDLIIRNPEFLLDNINYRNSFYLNYLTELAFELKLLMHMPSIRIRCAQITNYSEDFFELDVEEQLYKIFDASINISSKKLSWLCHLEGGVFTKSFMLNLLNNGLAIDEIYESIYSTIGIDIKSAYDNLEMDDIDYGEDLDKDLLGNNENAMLVASSTVMSIFLDMWFISVFGYYLQIIQPVYTSGSNVQNIMNDFYGTLKENHPIEPVIFDCPDVYDLTPLGEKIVSKYHKINGEKVQIINEKLENVYEDIMDEDECQELDLDLNIDSELTFETLAELFVKEMEADFKKSNSKKKVSKSNTTTNIKNGKDKVYHFKVKHFYNKRTWKTIAVKGTQSLHDLHKSIFDNFHLEDGHLYSFFMSNKAWDNSSEYTSPDAIPHTDTADKIQIHKLKLSLKQKFLYIYDFGDEIKFEIELVEAEDIDESVDYPICIKESKK